MPSFFDFQQGTEGNSRPGNDTAPLLGRFRAVPGQNGSGSNRRNSVGDMLWGRASIGYGSIFGGLADDDEAAAKSLLVRLKELWLKPTQEAVRGAVDRWWDRWLVLVLLPALLTVAWCAVPFPKYPMDDEGEFDLPGSGKYRSPGHGEARVQVNFWFFVFVYYGFYNLTALLWVTKVFNIYSLNWWPQSIGFPATMAIIITISLGAPIPLYFIPEARWYIQHNTLWIMWTFITMAMPVVVAFCILTNHERHLGLRTSLSETQRIFTTSWFANDNQDSVDGRKRDRRRQPINASIFDPDAPLDVALEGGRPRERLLRKRWIPASFVRFIWFCSALFIGLLAYVLGEVYAEIYLQTLPHSNIDTIFYVYSWVLTVHLLDGLTGWILGGEDGERVGSYPLGWIFKLYFMLTYQTYVRALYARLRSPQQFMILQAISSSSLIFLTPLTLSKPFHSMLELLHFTGQAYSPYQKFCLRNIFIRSLAENVSMLAFLGQILVLHFGPNQDIYPYFRFDDPDEPYDFRLTFWASSVTWACEIAAGWCVRRIVARGWERNVTAEGKMDLMAWPELLPTGLIVMVHVLQNMLFSIVRLSFW